MITGDRLLSVQGSSAFERLQLQKKYADIVVAYFGGATLFEPFQKAKGSFDVVTTQDPFWRGLIGLLIARMKGSRLNVQIHADLDAQGFFKRAVSRLVLARANSVRVVSKKIQEQVARVGVRAPISVLPIFIDLDRLKSVSREHAPHTKKVIVWAGRFEEEKDPFLALKVFKEALSHGVDAELHMLGAGSLGAQLKAEAGSLPVIFHPWQDPASFFASADVVLNTSKSEGYGAVIVEALALGVPVVAPDVGIAKEAGAVVVSRGALAQGIVDVLSSGKKGELKLSVLSKDEWAKEWVRTL